MNNEELETWARRLQAGEVSPAQFVSATQAAGSHRLPDTTLDLDRAARCGYPEVVYAEGKSIAALLDIFDVFAQNQVEGFATRVSDEQAEVLLRRFPQGRWNEVARTFRLPLDDARDETHRTPKVVVVTAGTSDLPVAEEARETIRWMGVAVDLIVDVGVAGPQRLLQRLEEIRSADCVVVVAGMEGALPSVVAGHVAVPVVAVPTSVGYGANFGGVAALLGMLNSCAANVAVVNIDAGFKAGYLAAMIVARIAKTVSEGER